MKLSWSHKLFLTINANVGKNKTLDRLMYFCGFWLIYFCLAGFFILAFEKFFFVSISAAVNMVILLALSSLCAYAISYTIAWIWPHERPEKELPQVKKLFRTLGTWKSFPSDHTIAVTNIALVVILSTSSLSLASLFLLAAALVAMGRVYAGVHYPRDIVGGFFIALFSVTLVVLLYSLSFIHKLP